MKTLILFAHHGEAISFIDAFSPTKKKTEFVEYFEAKNHYFLISGEGGQKVNEHLIHFLAHFKNKVKNIIHFGIAGALREEIKINTIYAIRTLYRYGMEKPFFNSFTTQHSIDKVDIITTDHRVLSDAISKKLKPFAQLIDMEAWYIASIAKAYKKDLKVFKCVSDFAGDDTQCLDIKNQALKYSQQFLNHYEQYYQISLTSKKNEVKNLPFFSLSSAFYLTSSQKTIFGKLLKSISLDQAIFKQFQAKLKEIEALDISPKKKTNRLIEEMRLLNNPYLFFFSKKLVKVKKKFRSERIFIDYNESLEKFILKWEIDNEKEWKNKLKYLQANPPAELFSYTGNGGNGNN